MNRSVQWTAVAAASLVLAAAAQAQSSVQIRGLVDMSAGRFQNAGTTRLYKADSGNMTTSWIGFKGAEDLGGGLKAVFTIDSFLQADTGGAGRFSGDAFWARDAFVGLSSASLGTATLGRNTTPLFVSTLAFNAIGDSFTFSPSIRQVLINYLRPFYGDTGWNNSILYSSPTFGGFTFNALGNVTEGRPGATGRNYSASMLYFGGPLAATLVGQRIQNDFGVNLTSLPPGFKSQDTYQGGVSYDFNVAKVFGQFTTERNKARANTKTTIYGSGVAVPLGGGKVLAQYGYARATLGGLRTVNRTLTVGYDYNVSKSTDLYAMGMQDRFTRQKNGNTLAAGIRMRF